MPYKRRIAVRGIITKNGLIFAQKLKKLEGASDYWCTPGGGLDDGESLEQGLAREMIEETGVMPIIGELLFVQQFFDGTREQLEFFYHIKNNEDYELIDLAATTHGTIEIAEYGFIDPTKENILPKFLQSTAISDYIDSPQPPLIMNYLPKHDAAPNIA